MLGDGIVVVELALVDGAEDGEAADGLRDAACLEKARRVGWAG